MLRLMTRTLLRHLGRDHRYFLLREAAETFGIASVTAGGPIGLIEGNLNDWTIFRRYVQGNVWEINTASICIDYFKRYGKGTFIDVGANIGMIFIPVIQSSGSSGIAIDASPKNYQYLATNCLRNLSPTSYTLHHVAVGDAAGKVRFNDSSTNFGDHRVSDDGAIEVDVIRFDDLVETRNLPKPILIKLDIQGYEPEFLAGATTLLSNCSAMLLEYSPFTKKDPDWVSVYDQAIITNFSRMVRYDTMHYGGLPSEGAFITIDQPALDRVKHDISTRKWTNIREGHENIILFST